MSKLYLSLLNSKDKNMSDTIDLYELYTQNNTWTDYMSNSYINIYGPTIRVFKLDKIATEKDILYNSETQHGRIYLPDFPIKALHDDGKWIGELNIRLYTETEQNLIFYVNLNNMVKIINDLRRQHISDLIIDFTGVGIPSIKKINNILTIYISGTQIASFDLEQKEYNSTRKLTTEINNLSDFSCELNGKNDLSKNIIEFNDTKFTGRRIELYTEDDTYKNITDVIEMGDGILTNKWRLYEVINATPAGDFGFKYHTWKLECKRANVEQFNLPGNIIELIQKNEYGLRDKIDMD